MESVFIELIYTSLTFLCVVCCASELAGIACDIYNCSIILAFEIILSIESHSIKWGFIELQIFFKGLLWREYSYPTSTL